MPQGRKGSRTSIWLWGILGLGALAGLVLVARSQAPSPSQIPVYGVPNPNAPWGPYNALNPNPYGGAVTTTGATVSATPNWRGPMGFQVQTSGTGSISFWNANMLATDFPDSIYQNQAAVIGGVTVGKVRVDLTYDGTTDQVDSTHLTAIDTSYGNQAATVIYGDDNYVASVANRISALQTRINIIKTFARPSGGPAFRTMYIPAGEMLNTNLNAANAALVTTADELLIQGQGFEDQAGGADPAFVGTMGNILTRVRQFGTAGMVVWCQCQCYGKTSGTVWPVGKMISDVNAMGALGYFGVHLFFNVASAATFTSTMAFYRPTLPNA